MCNREETRQTLLWKMAVDLKEAYEDHTMSGKQHQRHSLKAGRFHTALITNQTFVLDVLAQLDDVETKFVLTALVDYVAPTLSLDEQRLSGMKLAKYNFKASASILEKQASKRSVCKYQLVSALVVYGGDLDLLAALIDRGLDLRQKDDDGNTILHLLVDISRENPEKAMSAYHIIMSNVSDDQSRTKLILTKNCHQETALELASKLCLPEMMHTLLNTTNVYKFHIGDGGTFRHYLYDITEFNSRHLTPIHYISTASEAELGRFDAFSLLQKEPFATWMRDFVIVNRNATRGWMVLWFTLVISYILILFLILNSSPSLSTWVAHLIIVLVGGAMCVYEVVTFPSTLPILKLFMTRVFSNRFPAALASGYRLMQIMFIFSTTLTHLLHVVNCDLSQEFVAWNVMPTFYLNNIITGVLGLMFFTLLNNTLGHFLIAVEKISYAVFTYLMVASFYFAAFSLSFHLLHTCAFRNNCSTFNKSTVLGLSGDEASFESVPTSLYETIMLALGVTAPNEWYFNNNK
ncbi:hypothetical protein CAPTEDRAFT_205847 [Capitella teleta]|uniref:Uncharacterized protein n=1 Tax=Capitella teleta TaxID=283909 RepID=R7TQC1_CAPTE|nr:hypothetical protein CAPTEDRAFT_205847 [Capitella teleta]|eukprot:ELT95824.1 hypothetical protein CAPTEDRAFT_205847 [Capitella teleta]